MTALDRALAWFLEPPSSDRRDTGSDRAVPGTPREPAAPAPRRASPSAWLRPVPDSDPSLAPARPPVASAVFDDLAPAVEGPAARRAIRGVAVLGRPGHAEPVAAAVALALGAGAPARVATVVVIGRSARDVAVQHGSAGDAPPPSGGTRGARRLAARLDAHGLPARPRGRLVWVEAPSDGRQAAAQRAALVGAPAVLAVTAPRAPDIEELLAEQDLLLLVMADPAGPLARLAALGPGGVPVAVTRPLSRGPARSLALAGISAPRTIRRLATGTGEAMAGAQAA